MSAKKNDEHPSIHALQRQLRTILLEHKMLAKWAERSPSHFPKSEHYIHVCALSPEFAFLCGSLIGTQLRLKLSDAEAFNPLDNPFDNVEVLEWL